MKVISAILLLLTLSISHGLYGQKKDTGWIRGHFSVHFAPDVGPPINSAEGAVVTLMTAIDTFYTIATDGGFLFENVPLGEAKIVVTHLSYETVTQEVEVRQRTSVSIAMKAKTVTLPEMTVKGEVPLIAMHGDTMKFNAAAVALMDGDVALEILKQVPGVEITELGITVLGKNVRRTYVNRRMIFGRNEMAALVNLPASEVVSINTYEEYENPDSSRHRVGEEKMRVLDIKTKHPIFSATSGHALASVGHDFDPAGRTRYGIGATGNFFSEAFLFSANAFTNNVNRRSNRASDIISVRGRPRGYEKKDYAGVSAEKVWGDASGTNAFIRVVGDYSYDRTYALTENRLRDVYLPSASYTSRTYADTTYNSHTVAVHNISLGVMVRKIGVDFFDMGTSLRLSDDDGNYSRLSESMLDRNIIGSRSLNHIRQQGYVFTQRLGVRELGEEQWFNISVNYERTDHDGSAYREDSLASTVVKKVAESGPVGLSNKLSAKGNVNIRLAAKQSLLLAYYFDYENVRRQRFASDLSNLSNPLTDTVNTYDYTNNFNRHRIYPTWIYEKGSAELRLGLAYQSSSSNRDERFPEAGDFRRRQHAWLPSFQFTWEGGTDFQLTYNTSTTLPSMEQWRNQLDNRQLYQLVAGNPGLKQSYTHNIDVTNDFLKKEGGLRIGMSLAVTEHVIAAKTTYFTTDTPLPQWHAVAPAQSSLIEYVNLNGRVIGQVSMNYGRMVETIKSRVSIVVLFDYDADPSYIQAQLAKTYNYSPTLQLSLRSNFSSQFRIEAKTKGRYIYSKNTLGQESRVLNMTGNVTTNWNITKIFFLNTAYDLSFYKSYTGLFNNTITHVLNAVAGCKLLKGGLELSVAAYDVLNRNMGFKTLMTNDYVRNTWTQSFGRYFSFNIAYKFFKSKSGLKNPAGIKLQDGGVKQ
jgi:hypothetical protein